MLNRLWYSQFPEWARPQHPIMRSIMGATHGVSRRRTMLRVGLIVVVLVLAVAGSFLLENEVTLRDVLYGPLVIAQVMAVVVALTLTANAVSTEEQRGTWDTLKLTIVGVPLTLRARWINVFHQLRWLLALIVLGRIAYVGLLLYDITDFQGRALDLYISGITPEVSLDVTILLMVCFMTAFIMLPVVAVAVSAAVGIVMSVVVRSKSLVFVFMLLAIGLYLGSVAGGIRLGEITILERTRTLVQEDISPTQGWGSLAAMSMAGDMGIKLTSLETQGQIWADFNNGIFFGGFYLLGVIVLGILANLVVEVSAKRASLPTRT